MGKAFQTKRQNGLLQQIDTLAEWLRRRPAKPVGSARVGSNPTGVDFGSFPFRSLAQSTNYHSPFYIFIFSYRWQCVRVVKESDSKSDGLCPRGFESLRCRFYSLSQITMCKKNGHRFQPLLRHSYKHLLITKPNIAQLVERSTVEGAGIEWSLVRFRVFGLFSF